MKKIIIIALAVLLCGSAYASKLEVSGDAYYRGKSMTNYGLAADSNSVITNNQYDFDMNVHTKFVVDDTTFAYARFAIRDMTAGATQDPDTDDDIAVERSYLSTKIGPSQVDVGLMTGGEWGTVFANSAAGKWRIKTVTTTPVGAVVAVIQKDAEGSSSSHDDRDDVDNYYLGLVTQAGPMFIKPLFVLTDYNAGDPKTYQAMTFALAVDGVFGDISVEAEFVYTDVKLDNSAYSAGDHSVMGFYAAATMKMGDNSFGGFVAYASVDDDTNKAFGMGEDLTCALIFGNDIYLGTDASDANMNYGFTLVGLQASFKVMDKLTVSPMFYYGMSNFDDGDLTQNIDTAMEFDLNAKYQVNDAVAYSFGIGYATATKLSGTDPEPIQVLYHKLAIAF